MKRTVALLTALMIGITNTALPSYAATKSNTEASAASSKSKSSLSMLNYMTVLTQEINSSSNSKVYLENAYSSIVNNVNPNAVDDDTFSEIQQLLNTINAYQSIATNRERTKLLYDQNKATAMQKALPSPLSVMNIVHSQNAFDALISAIYLAVDTKTSYTSYTEDLDQKYLEDTWALDDSAKQNLHESRSSAFSYMVAMCQDNNIDGNLALNESSVKNFVSWEINPNKTRRIDFLEKNKSTYEGYGKYWLVLAKSYYENGDYDKCLDALGTYEGMDIDIFRKDKDFAQALTIGISAAQQVYSGNKYIEIVDHYAKLILDNITTSDWALRYFAAETYVNLAGATTDKTQKTQYLQKAYDEAESNVNYLLDEQLSENKKYLAPITEIKASKNDSKAKKAEIKNYNSWLKATRKIELPPVYQPLVLNCNLLFDLAKELNFTDKEKKEIEDILHNGDTLFLTTDLEEKYWFNKPSSGNPTSTMSFNGKKVEIPAVFLSSGASLKVIVTGADGKKEYTDWQLDEVDRNKSSNVNDFKATYSSKSIGKQKYTADSKISVEIIPSEEAGLSSKTYNFSVKKSKKFKVLDDTTFILEG